MRQLIVTVCLLSALCCFTWTARAAFTDDFDGLRAELVNRSDLLSNSTDKVEIKQKKACDQSIVLIDKPAKDLGVDIKTGKKVATKMIKAFPSEFVPAPAVVFSNNIVQVLLGSFSALGEDVNVEIVTLAGLIATTPDGKDKLKAAAQFTIATNLITLAQSALTFAQGSQLLGGALKAALKGQQAAIKGGGGGGSTNNTMSATIVIGGTNYNWSAPLGGIAEYAPNSVPQLDIAGGDGVFSVNSTLCSNFTGVAGDYALGSGCVCGVVDFSNTNNFFVATSGTLHIATFDTPTTSLSGTFNYSASDGTTTITVTNGQFDLHNLQVSP